MRRSDPREDIVHYAHKVYVKGWVANHDGNLTVRLAADRFLSTPTALSKGDVTANDLIVVDKKGTRVSGHRGAFSELALHLAAYEARADARAVVHAHPPYATALGVAGLDLARPIIAEAVVSLGDCIPLIPFSLPRTDPWTADIAKAIVHYDALLLQNHGVITCGDDLEQAFLRMELVEHLARIVHHSMAFGGPRYLDPKDVPPLLAARKKAGLGPEARGLGPPPHTAKPAAAPVATDRVAQLVLEELRRLQGS